MKIKKLLAKNISYNSTSVREYSSIRYIVIHYTGNRNDTAENNAKFYATGNIRQAGAHFFVDKQGIIFKSVAINRIAWSVGGSKYNNCSSGGTYYGKCTNANSISIELCDCLEDTSTEQIKSCKEVVKYIQKVCPNARTIIRHFDVTGKNCPAPFAGKNNKKWDKFLKDIS